jgi:hypothetical protein
LNREFVPDAAGNIFKETRALPVPFEQNIASYAKVVNGRIKIRFEPSRPEALPILAISPDMPTFFQKVITFDPRKQRTAQPEVL